MEEMASDGAFLRAIEHKSPQINVCRTILRKPTGKRTLEDIHVVRCCDNSVEWMMDDS